MSHASPDRPSASRSPFGRPLRIAVVVAALLGGAGVAGALAPTVDDAAIVDQTATRLVATTNTDGLLFPIEPTPVCEVFNNFGGFSKTYGTGGHQGVDIGAEVGQEVYAVEDGELYRKFDDLTSAAGYGWGLWAPGSDTKYRYYHLSEFAEGLEEGDQVVKGQVIGYVGDTGNATPGGWHLHFEVRPGPEPHEIPVDPVPLLAIPEICHVY